MKKLVINLPERTDRKAHFQGKHIWLDDVEFITAINGHDVDHAQMKKNGFSINHTWRDPFRNRRMTKGEVGCWLSHYSAWQKCLELNENVIILEDDAILNKDLWDEDKYAEIMKSCAFLYLGYNENDPDGVESIDEDVEKVAYPYNLHAYVITPHTASELINSGFHRKMIPVDEQTAQMTDRIEQWALKEHVAKQALRSDLKSNIEPEDDYDWAHDFTLHPITIGTDTSKCSKLNESAMKQGFSVKNIGANRDWKGTDMSGAGGGHKIVMIKEYLATLPEDDVVLFTDAYDVFYMSDLDDITRRYLDMQAEIIFAAESEIWPEPGMASKHPTPETKYRYLNSGTFIGRVGSLKELFAEDLNPDDDDQLYIQRIWLHDTTKFSLALDYEQYIFQTNDPGLKMVQGQLYNSETTCFPCVYHGNGGDYEKETFNRYYEEFYGKPIENPMYIPHMGRAEILEKDMLLIDFMTPSQCERLIELSDAHNGWAPMPGDKFPAYEIRIKELGMEYWKEMEKHWEDHVYPIIEKYWWPMQMYGLRDAFTMRYSVDTQRSLPMHNDASLVTGSVKLNDNYKGASLVFPRQGINNDDIPVGKMILFPGQVTHGHECTDLIKGVKYSLTMWSSRYSGDVN